MAYPIHPNTSKTPLSRVLTGENIPEDLQTQLQKYNLLRNKEFHNLENLLKARKIAIQNTNSFFGNDTNPIYTPEQNIQVDLPPPDSPDSPNNLDKLQCSCDMIQVWILLGVLLVLDTLYIYI